MARRFAAVGAICLITTLGLIQGRNSWGTPPSFQPTAPVERSASGSPTSFADRLRAIVQLRGLNAPPPQTTGSATFTVQPVPKTQIYTLPVTMGGRAEPFLFDTGASTTLISAPTAQRLRLVGQPVPRDRLNFAVAGDDCPQMTALLHRMPPMAIAQVQIQGLSSLQFTSTDLPDHLAGVLGMDVLGQFDVAFNPRRQQLSLRSQTQLPSDWQPRAIPLRRKSGVMLAQVKVNRLGPFTMLLDTGADGIFISEHVASQVQLPIAHRRPIRIQGFCGIEQAARAPLNEVQLHNHRQANLETIILSDSSILGVLGVDGILGQTFLNRYQQYWRFTPMRTTTGTADGSLLLLPVVTHKQQ